MKNNFQGSLLRNLLLPVGDFVFGQRMISRLKFLEKAQWWSMDEIFAYQQKALQRLIQVSYSEVPFYHHLLDSLEINPKSIRTKQDLNQLPVISKSMLRQNYPQQTVRKTGQRTYEAKTSGSTGQNFVVREDPYTAGWYRSTLLLSLEWAGWSIGDPHMQTGMTLTRSFDRKLKDFLMNCHYVSAYRLDDQHLSLMLEEIEKNNLQFLFGYPGSVFCLANYAISTGWNKPLRSVVTWGDMLYPHFRQTIEKAFNTKVFDTYGCSEGFHIAAQCEVDHLYHIHDLDVIVEFLGVDNMPVAPGTPGRVVVTRLHPGPMPFIRYEVGDIAVPTMQRCACGRGFSTLDHIQGRDTDIITTPKGNRLIVHFFTGILEHFTEIDTFQVIQERRDEIILYLVAKSDISQEALTQIVKTLRSRGIDDLKVNIQTIPEIPLTDGGKRRFIINKMLKTS